MAEVTQLLEAIESGDRHAAADLLPLVYDELRRLARANLQQERPGQTLQPTALVHEAYLRLVGQGSDKERRESQGTDPRGSFSSRGHFFVAAAEAMRRILVESARRKARCKHGGELNRVDLPEEKIACELADDRLLALDEALDRLNVESPDKAQLVKLRYFAGMHLDEAAAAMGISRATAARHWTYARAWLFQALAEGEKSQVQ
jgi:RNA polymerase sigma factor (TIGR02999 family)